MFDPRIDKLASILVNYSLGVKAGEWIVIEGDAVAIPLIEAASRHVLRAGANPTTLITTDNLQEIRLREANDSQLAWVDPVLKLTTEKMDGHIYIWSTTNTRALANVDIQKQQKAQAALGDILETAFKREQEGTFRWVGTQYPSLAYAQEANMSLQDYEDFFFAATFADQANPAQHWNALHKRQQQLVDWLAGKKKVEVRGSNAQLTLSIEGRKFINADGHGNMPSGEIFTSPVEDSANGWIAFTYPCILDGHEIDGIRLEFQIGQVSKASATKNEAFLHSQLEVDEGARFLGEFAVGTNTGIQHFTRSILFDEKMAGTMHVALGRGFSEAGGTNMSAIHMDLICDMRDGSAILVDDEVFYRDGEFQI